MFIYPNRAVAKKITRILKTAKRSIIPSVQLTIAFLFLIPTFSFGSVADWFYSSDRDKTHQSYTQNNYAYRDTFSNFLPSTLGLFSITPQKDFLYGSFTKDTARMWEMNGTLSHDLKTYVAPNINASDYGSVKIENNKVWEQHSFVTGMYEPQKFSNVQVSGNAYKSFDVATARDNWIVRERADNITYDAANRPTSMILRTYDIAGNVFVQKMDNIVYASSADAGRRQTMLADAQSKIEKTKYYGHRQIYDGLIETLDPAKYVPTSFNILTRDPRGNTTSIAFTNVQWKNDAVIGFDATITHNGTATTMHAMPVFSNEGQRIGVTVDVTDTAGAGTRAFTWKADDQVAFKDFDSAKQVMQGVNPLDIMGSSRVQIGEVKVAWLAQGYDNNGLLHSTVAKKIETSLGHDEQVLYTHPDGKIGVFEAFNHYREGSGKPLVMSFNQIDTSNVRVSEFPQVERILERHIGDGSITIHAWKPFTTQGNNFLVLGNITLVLDGTLKIQGDMFTFNGTMYSKNDKYDFNRSTHRGFIGEWLTSLGRKTNGVPFKIIINGSQHIEQTGTKYGIRRNDYELFY